MKKFTAKIPNGEYRFEEVAGVIIRILLTPLFLLARIYRWVWDYKYFK